VLRFHGELNDFLPSARRHRDFEVVAGVTDTPVHVIESAGVPHTEIGGVLASDARIDVFPHQLPVALDPLCFVLDGHLGRLAAYLRMLGFDCWYSRTAEDVELAHIASSETRVLLTRDVGLLKRREVERGYCVRQDRPRDQLREVVERFALRPHMQPFHRCMACNGELAPVPKSEVARVVPPYVLSTKDVFSRCVKCRKVYWRGSHHAVMSDWIADLSH
jgi:uncharacterized protein with PIN domain